MTSTGSPASDTVTPANFERIVGIGPITERRLHDADILTFAQLGAMSPADIYAVVEGISGISIEIIAEKDWSGQALKMVSESGPAESHPGAASRDRQHHAAFTVDLSLDEDNNVHLTRVGHVQSKDEVSWPGWDERRMIKFIVQHAALRLPSPKPVPQPKLPDSPTLEITEATTQEVDSVAPSNVISTNQTWSIHTEWELSGATVDMLTGNWLIQAHLESMGPGQEYSLPAGGGARVPLSDFTKPEGTIYTYQYRHDINAAAGTVAAGAYRFVVAVTWEKEGGMPGDLVDFFEGMLQLYA
ncbi:MAG: hypothetical protein SXV54_17230 [Chloroflexota bacterium]|nr:hypothetical protein [Chloroflexota bacterium]